MAAMKKRNLFKSPKGIASYAYLNAPDTQFSAEGIYKTELKVDQEKAQPLVDTIKKIASSEFGDKAAKAKLPYEVDSETGQVTFKFKSKYKPSFYDAQATMLHEDKAPLVYGGATIIVGGNAYPYTVAGATGVSLQMNSVQIIHLQDNSGYAPFEAEEGGSFVASNDNETSADGDDEYNF